CRYLFNALVVPKLVIAAIQRLFPGKPKPAELPPNTINRIAQAYFKLELFIASRLRMPFGSSLIAVLQKPLETTANTRIPNLPLNIAKAG
ncbi:MAG: hypothetical protein KTR15_16300, partial [Phycisphaeraceae bacterium]|nr:hypothetical protein [Phycisphaeraceae bacterium]